MTDRQYVDSGSVYSFPTGEPVVADLKGSGGGGTYDPMEARVAVLEADLGHIKSDIGEMKADIRDGRRDARTDFRVLFGALIAVALGLAGLMARGFGWL